MSEITVTNKRKSSGLENNKNRKSNIQKEQQQKNAQKNAQKNIQIFNQQKSLSEEDQDEEQKIQQQYLGNQILDQMDANNMFNNIYESEQKDLVQVQMPQILYSQSSSNEKQQQIQQDMSDNSDSMTQLIIQPLEKNQSNFYQIQKEGGKIGRHSSNTILILEESISRYHAEIFLQNENFYIQDIGSTTGTFIKITQKQKLDLGTIVEIGSNQFEVIKIDEENLQINLQIIEGMNVDQSQLEIKFSEGQSKTHYTIGRKPTNTYQFINDPHLSNLHCQISLNDGVFYLEDMESTNGTWLRLSRESDPSLPYLLQDQSIFKIGTVTSFICKYLRVDNNIKQKNEDNLCVICCQNERDVLYIPCQHSTACVKCSKQLTFCPICRIQIVEFIKIYKA